MNAILGLAPTSEANRALAASTPTDYQPPSKPRGPLKVYTRSDLLRLSGRTRVPRNMASFESWYGTPQNAGGAVRHDDPAIASIASPGSRRTGGAGGFGEGFGFGGGIGIGRGLGRGGTRNIGCVRVTCRRGGLS